MAMLRRFGQLATLSQTSLGQAIELFRSSPVEKRLAMSADYTEYAASLLAHKHSSNALSELVSFAVSQKTPIAILKHKDELSLKTFMVRALLGGNMKDVNSALFLHHCHPFDPIPSFDVYTELVTRIPTGSAENQKLWRKTMCEMLYYSFPACMNRGLNNAFFALYGPISESLVAFMRLAAEGDLPNFDDCEEDIQEIRNTSKDQSETASAMEEAPKKSYREDAAAPERFENPLLIKTVNMRMQADDSEAEDAELSMKDEVDDNTSQKEAQRIEDDHFKRTQVKAKHRLDDFLEEYMSRMNPRAYTAEDYELARDYFLFEATSNLRRFPRDSVNALLSVAREHKDWEFICRLFLHHEEFTAGHRSDLLVSCVLQSLLHANYSGNRWAAIKKIVSDHISRPINADKMEDVPIASEPVLCQFESTNSAMISGLISSGLYERAALYMFDCRRCDLPYDPRYELKIAEHFREKKDLRNLMLVREASDDLINTRRLVEWTEELRYELQQKGEVQESHYLEEKYYKYTDGLLRPYLQSLGIPVADNADEDYKYSPELQELMVEFAKEKVDLEEAEADPRVIDSEDEGENDEKADPAGIGAEIRNQVGEKPNLG